MDVRYLVFDKAPSIDSSYTLLATAGFQPVPEFGVWGMHRGSVSVSYRGMTKTERAHLRIEGKNGDAVAALTDIAPLFQGNILAYVREKRMRS